MAYPLLLLCVVGLIIWFVRWLLLPQLENLMTPDIRQKHLLVNILLFSLEELPLISGTFFLLVFIFAYLIYLHYLRLSQMAQLIWLHHWPVIRHLQEDYLSWQFTLELSALLEQGISLKEALEQLRDPTMRPAIRCIAKHLTTEAIKGRQMSDSLQDLPFLRQDLGLVIRQGDMLSQEATKLRLLAEKYFEDFTNRFKRLLLFVQPLLFSIVALLIMSIYLILLMPMLTMLDQGF